MIDLALILVLARAGGEVARRTGQPEVVGELLAGFLLGPSVFGALLPALHHSLLLDPDVGSLLTGLSWIGAILLLLMAGIEVDLTILRREARPGALAGALAIIPSLIAGSLFAAVVLDKAPPGGFYLGIVLSVTAVSVVSKILLERGAMRRDYAQLMLAAGVASEVVVWLFVSVVSAFHSSSPLLAGLRSTAFAVGFFVVMMTIGRRFTFWAMRRVRDATWIIKGQHSLVLVLTFGAAAVTQALGLHALLGAFVVGVLLSQAPRTTDALVDDIQALTLGLFGPIFFVLAGMRVDITRLGSLSTIGTILLLFVVATGVKVGCGALGARLGGHQGWEAALVGVGLNLKGGTDVVVAVIGTELGLLSVPAYSMYAVVGILTVLLSPPVMTFLERHTPPGEEETQRLESEEATRRAYVPRLERVLVPVENALLPTLAASVVQRLAASKQEQGQLFDITEMDVCRGPEPDQTRAVVRARDRLEEVGQLRTVEVTQQRIDREGVLDRILELSEAYDLVAIGARPPAANRLPTLGRLQDAIIHRARSDVLVAVDEDGEHLSCDTLRRILVPTNGLEYSMAAGDIAGALAASCGAAVMLLHVVHSDVDEHPLQERDQARLEQNAEGIMDELAFRIGRLGVTAEKRVVVGDNAGEEILRELARQPYGMVVMGGIDRGTDDRPYLGRSIRTVLIKGRTPAVVLVTRQTSGAVAA